MKPIHNKIPCLLARQECRTCVEVQSTKEHRFDAEKHERNLSTQIQETSGPYIRDQEARVWLRPDNSDIVYSDGKQSENAIHSAVVNCKDRSLHSSELRAQIKDWPSEYHFSEKRHMVLAPLNIQQGDSVLELGCGCGAITRYLGELGAEVTSVEGTMSRARTAAARCADLSNVDIHLDNFIHFQTKKKFDWVLFIGVLEYAPLFGEKGREFASYLDIAKRYLKPKGQMAIAIENKLGLKYFNGFSEDHVGTAYFGLEDQYVGRSAETFSKKELTNLLVDNGFKTNKFFYAFPDYKLCDVVFSDAAIEDPTFKCADMLVTLKSRDYLRNHNPNFSEGLVAASMEKAGLLGEVANSFLVVSSAGHTPSVKKEILAFTHNVGGRASSLACATTFRLKGKKIRVEKAYLSARQPFAANFNGHTLTHCLDTDTYISGELEYGTIFRAIQREPRPARYWQSFLPWSKHLLSEAIQTDGPADQLESYEISGEFFDATPMNFVRAEKGFKLIDREWRIAENLPLGYVLYRGVAHAIERADVHSKPLPMTRRCFLALVKGLELRMNVEKIPEYRRLERSILAQIGPRSV